MYAALPPFQNQDFSNKKVIVRADLNVPIQDNCITEDIRIQAILPTLTHLMNQQATVIIVSHLGRPKGQVSPQLSLQILVKPLSKYLNCEVVFINDCIGKNVQDRINALPQGSIIILENCRFHPEEEQNDPQFAQELSQLADAYINDGFGVSHRAHASVVGITHYLPSYAGFLLQSEMAALSQGWLQAQDPLMLIIGGAKISTKLALLSTFVEKAQTVVVGGGIANTLLKAGGKPIGASLYEADYLGQASEVINKAAAKNCRLIMPIDVNVSLGFNQPTFLKTIDEVEADDKIFDIGPLTIELIKQALVHHKTVIWNGPLGVFEHPPFDQSTQVLARSIADLSAAQQLYSLAGGGETVAALKKCHAADDFSYLSTGGGAFLEFLEGKELPGIRALQRQS